MKYIGNITSIEMLIGAYIRAHIAKLLFGFKIWSAFQLQFSFLCFSEHPIFTSTACADLESFVRGVPPNSDNVAVVVFLLLFF